jgi:hypothetical protein
MNIKPIQYSYTNVKNQSFGNIMLSEEVAKKVQGAVKTQYKVESDIIDRFQKLKNTEVDIYSENTHDFKKSADLAGVNEKMKNVTVVITDMDNTFHPTEFANTHTITGATVYSNIKFIIPELNKKEFKVGCSAAIDRDEAFSIISKCRSPFNELDETNLSYSIIFNDAFIDRFVKEVKESCKNSSEKSTTIIRENFVDENLVYKD